jgi:hypothetical protein
MALIDKNIIITPSIGANADPKIVFSGADATTLPQNVSMTAYPISNGTLSFDGIGGQLFSVTGSMTGTIFSVNDISGIPSIEVLDTGLVKIAQYNGNVSISTTTVTGTVDIATGNTASGNTKTVNIGTGSLAGSTTNVNIGSTGGTSTVRLYGSVVANLAASNSYSYNNLTNVPIAVNTPYANVTFASTITLTDNSNIRVTCTGNTLINPPASGTDGSVVRMWLVASGANVAISVNTSIKIPSSSAFTSPQTIVNTQKARMSIQYDSVRAVWELVSFVNGY